MNSSNSVGGEQCLSGTNGEIPIRTVYVGGIALSNVQTDKSMIDEIRRYFEQFGEIESVAVRFEDNNDWYCFIQFKREEDANKALLRSNKRWNNCKVEAADPWHQPDHPLSTPPEQESNSNILIALNDDCLKEIFKYLKLSSLTNVAEVCKKFNEHAKTVFALKHKHLDIRREFRGKPQSFIETAMNHFGKDVQSLRLVSNMFKTEVDAVHMISQRCGPKLKQLRLENFRFKIDLQQLRSIFATIEQLELCVCTASISLSHLLAGCVELKSLKLFKINNTNQDVDTYIIRQTFPKLQEFALVYTELNNKTFESFAIRNPNLIKLSADLSLTTSMFRTIGRHVKRLQELKFNGYFPVFLNDTFQNNIALISQLNALRKIQLKMVSPLGVHVLNALVAGAVPIEDLDVTFHGVTIDVFIKTISQLKRIKILRLVTIGTESFMTDAFATELTQCLPQLEQLAIIKDSTYAKSKLGSIGLRKMLVNADKLKLLKLERIESIKIDIDDYKIMLNTVLKRKEKIPLEIEILGAKEQIHIPQEVLAKNRNTINIKIRQFHW